MQIQTVRLNPPRDCTHTETRESLNTWLEYACNYFSRDDHTRRFILPAATWDPDAADYGFVAEGQDTKLRRTAPEVAAALTRFFSTISSFFPFTFLTRRLMRSTSWESVKQKILEAFNFQLNGVSLLKAVEIKREAGENWHIFYEKVYDHFSSTWSGPTSTWGGSTRAPLAIP